MTSITRGSLEWRRRAGGFARPPAVDASEGRPPGPRRGESPGDLAAAAVDAAGLLAWELDLSTRALRCADLGAAKHWFGASLPRHLVDYLRIVHRDDRGLLDVGELVDRAATAEGGAFVVDYRLTVPGSPQRWVQTRGSVLAGPDGAAERIVATTLDVTQQRTAIRARLQIDRVLRHTIEASSDAYVSFDRRGIVTGWNRAAELLFGRSPDDALGQPVSVILPRDASELWRELASLAASRSSGPAGGGQLLEITAARSDGTSFPAEATVVVVRDGPTTSYGLFLRDITERKAVEDQLSRRALTDPLTGLPNRALVVDRLARALTHHDGRPGPLPAMVGVIFVDLDRFKRINDSHGHQLGDQVLRALAQRMIDVVRPADTVGRMGGDEFVVVVDGMSNADEVVRVANRIVGSLSDPVVAGDRALRVAASAGVAVATESMAPDTLLANADRAMYRAKELGGGRVERFTPTMRVPTLARLGLEGDLRDALNRDELHVVYQPLVALNGTVHGFEALLRWNHPLRGAIPPSDFVALAEETGQIGVLGRWVLHEACRQVVRWRATHPALTMSINVSARQVCDPSFAEVLRATLTDTTTPPAALVLELTEGALAADPGAMLAGLNRLRDLGVTIAVDDFGTGSSSLLYLRRFPVQSVKLDRGLIAGLDRARDALIVGSVIDLAHALGMAAFAEGVETERQLEILRRARCDGAQGYLWSRPVVADDVAALLTGDPLPTLADRDADRPPRLAGSALGERRPVHRVVVIDGSGGAGSLDRERLESAGQLLVAAEATDVRSGIAAVLSHQPDLVLLDTSLPGSSGIDAIPDVLAAAPHCSVVVVSDAVAPGVRALALGCGASACLDRGGVEAYLTSLGDAG
jgi:diguanylate cyclase (GGDEF)-like protein/PAS domain S-box-containing protein